MQANIQSFKVQLLYIYITFDYFNKEFPKDLKNELLWYGPSRFFFNNHTHIFFFYFVYEKNTKTQQQKTKKEKDENNNKEREREIKGDWDHNWEEQPPPEEEENITYMCLLLFQRQRVSVKSSLFQKHRLIRK